MKRKTVLILLLMVFILGYLMRYVQVPETEFIGIQQGDAVIAEISTTVLRGQYETEVQLDPDAYVLYLEEWIEKLQKKRDEIKKK